MMKLTEFVKKELSGWKIHEVLGLLFVFCLIIYNKVKLGDSNVVLISAVFGILYTVMAGKGKISCYAFGLLGSSCYIMISMLNHLWGNAVLYAIYYIPMQIHGIFSWMGHLKEQSLEIKKTRLKAKERVFFFAISIIGCAITSFVLYIMNDANPIIDGVTTFLSIIGMYFTVKRFIDQWVVWIVVNLLSFIMWLDLVIHGVKAYSTLVMWGFYFILAVYFYIVWLRDLRKLCKTKV